MWEFVTFVVAGLFWQRLLHGGRAGDPITREDNGALQQRGAD